jgi:hypothetical protein
MPQWDLQDPSTANSEAAKAAMLADDLSRWEDKSAVPFTAHSALHAHRSLVSPSAATGASAHPLIEQSPSPSARSTAAPPQSLSGPSRTGNLPSRSAFKSDFNYLGRAGDDNSKLGGWKKDEIAKINGLSMSVSNHLGRDEGDESKLGGWKKDEIAKINNLSLA